MKRFEKVLVILTMILLLLDISMKINGVDLMLFVLLTLLSIFYFVLGFFLINNIELKDLFKKSSYSNISVLRMLGSFFGAAHGLSTVAMGILFIIMHYEGGINLLVIGLVTCAIVVVVSLIRYLARHDKFYLKVISRLCLWIAMAVIVYITYP